MRALPRGGEPVAFAPVPDAPPNGVNHGAGGRFWLVHLDPADRSVNGSGGADGLVALAGYCTHLNCTLPWRPAFEFEGERGWFRCPCHGATFTRAGRRVFGPAPRGLDTYRVEISDDGTVYVDRTRVARASRDKPAPAVPVPKYLRDTT